MITLADSINASKRFAESSDWLIDWLIAWMG